MQTSDPALISIVDDDPSVGDAIARLLRANGFATATFLSAASFLASPERTRTAVLILDVCMPGMSGVDFYRHLAVENRSLPTIFITAHGNAQDREVALAEGAIDYLNKPFTEAALLSAIRKVIPS